MGQIKLTWVLSLFTKASSPSLETLEGRFTAGASGFPSSSDTNWTTMLGEGFGTSGAGSGTPWYTFTRFGGGSKVAILSV